MLIRSKAAAQTGCRKSVIVCLLLAAIPLGCSGSSARISGTVNCNGKAVTEGTISFTPVAAEGDRNPGIPGLVDVQADGSYSVNVQSGSSGILASRYTVRFTANLLKPPVGKATFGAKDMIPSLYHGYVPKRAEVEVHPGQNNIDVELVPGKKPGQG